MKAIIVYRDSVNVVYLSSNLIQHQHIKHIEINIHFMREKVARDQICILHITLSNNRHFYKISSDAVVRKLHK